MILNRHISSNNEIRTKILNEKGLKLSSGSFEAYIQDNKVKLKIKEDRSTNFTLTFHKSILEDLDIHKVYIEKLDMMRNRYLGINIISENVILRNSDILNGHVEIPNIQVGLIGETPEGNVTFDENGMIYMGNYKVYFQKLFQTIQSVKLGNRGGFYFPVKVSNMEYIFKFLSNREALDELRSILYPCDSFSILIIDNTGKFRINLDFNKPSNNYICPY